MGDIHAHNLFDMWMFGCSYGQYEFVHKLMDHPWVEIFAKEHRRIMHDEKSILWIESQYGVMPGLVARGHRALDIAFSGAKHRDKLQD